MHLVRRGQPADRIQERTSNKRGFVAGGRRFEVQRAELVQHQSVDEVAPRRLGKHCVGDLLWKRSNDTGHDDLRRKPGRDGSRAVSNGRHCAASIDRRNGFVGGCKLRPPRDIPRSAVAVRGSDLEACGLPRRHHAFHWRNLDRTEPFVAFLVARTLRRRAPRRDPGRHDRIAVAAGVQPLAAFVGDGRGGLCEEKAAARIAHVDTTAARLTRDRQIVAGGIVAKKREAKAALTSKRSVATTGIATGLR